MTYKKSFDCAQPDIKHVADLCITKTKKVSLQEFVFIFYLEPHIRFNSNIS